MAIPTLIDKKDNFEIIRDQIAAILVSEIASQQALATTAGKDPDDWKLRIFTERSNPWEQFLNDQTDKSPLVNIWYDRSTFDKSGSNIKERQKTNGIFNIDCYGFGISSNVSAGGHIAGDENAAFEVQKCLRLVRNILMAAEYTYLGIRGLVWQRWPQSTNVFQPDISGNNAQQIIGGRLPLEVAFNEFSPQFISEVLEYLAIDVIRAEDGQIVLESDYDYTI